LRKYRDGVKNLRRWFLPVTLMWWNDDCKQHGQVCDPALDPALDLTPVLPPIL